MPIAGLILAAGGSTRMKTAKQLLPWGKDSLLQHVIQTARQSNLDTAYLVLGCASEAIKQQADLEDLTIIENRQWQDGLGTSIATGVNAVSRSASNKACLILLADQPFITADYLNMMIEAYHADRIIASDYNGKAGVPCLFPRRFFPNLMALQGDRGAGKLLNELNEHVHILEASVDLRDIDTPETYSKNLPK